MKTNKKRLTKEEGAYPSDFIAFGARKSLLFYERIQGKSKPLIVIAESDAEAEKLSEECSIFCSNDEASLIHFIQGNDTLPYDEESPSTSIASSRMRSLDRLFGHKRSARLVFLSKKTLIERLVPGVFWASHSELLFKGKELTSGLLSSLLNDFKYVSSTTVLAVGDYAAHRYILDVFPYGYESPLRITFKEGVVHSIHKLNIGTQLSMDEVDEVKIFSSKEMPINIDIINKFSYFWRSQFGRQKGKEIISRVREGAFFPGCEYYLPFFSNNPETILDYFPQNFDLCFTNSGSDSLKELISSIHLRFSDLLSDSDRCCLPPERLWMTSKDVDNMLRSTDSFSIYDDSSKENGLGTLPILSVKSGVERSRSIDLMIERLSEAFSVSDSVVIFVETDHREKQLELLVNAAGFPTSKVSDWSQIGDGSMKVKIFRGIIDQGFYDNDKKLTFISEKEIFGSVVLSKKEALEVETKFDMDFSSLEGVVSGMPLVSKKHGVCIFDDLELIQLPNGPKREVASLDFANNSSIKLFADELDDLIGYSGMEEGVVPVNDLSKKQWSKDCAKATRSAMNLANNLVEIKKKSKRTYSKPVKFNSHSYELFCGEFPFTETVDQTNAEVDIRNDLQSSDVMRRVVCGDVGFGKTEVAMRAAFMVASSGKQVVFLAPTTLLAKQHYENFLDRFSNISNIKVHLLSRSVTKSDEKRIVKELNSGEVGIYIGTHRLIQNDILFGDLGLIIIDEEHRFGKKQKEAIQERSVDNNTLYMSATPIPRTMGMTLIGLKNISNLRTPPSKRLSIRTYSRPSSPGLIKEVIQREVSRGGQVFYLNNKIEELDDKKLELEGMTPGLRVCIIHGRMKAVEMEQTMFDFISKKYDLLLCTTVIETGIDVPNANTIIIERAENFGLSQLHQLRGRVGRSTRQAYAYLLTKDDLKPHQESRINALIVSSGLGDGAALAYHDLETRGAGEILGEEQSGDIQKVGYYLYLKFIRDSLQFLNTETGFDVYNHNVVVIDLGSDYYIPSEYISSKSVRITTYLALLNLKEEVEANKIESEMIDRFGPMPDILIEMIEIGKLRLACRKVGISMLIKQGSEFFIKFSSEDHFSMSGGGMAIMDSNFSLIDSQSLMMAAPKTSSLAEEIKSVKLLVEEKFGF